MASTYTTTTGKASNKTPKTSASHNPFIVQNQTETTPQPESTHGNTEKNAQPGTTSITPPIKYVWKPGHGAIEKVDKRTGDIYHLAEYVQQAA